MEITTVLFDLDGTLLDTAPDLAWALNQLREENQLAPLPLTVIRPTVGYGSRSMLKLAFNVDENHPRYTGLVERLLNLYQTRLSHETKPFSGMLDVLAKLEDEKIIWGIVTNKPSRFTYDILKAMKLEHRAAVIICGDSLSRRKPNPDQILHACEKLKQNTEKCVYVGDTSIDVVAGKAAGTKTLVAMYGYIAPDEHPLDWQADGYLEKPLDIIDWLTKRCQHKLA